MAEAISCPHCDRQMALRAELAGQRVACPHCRETFVAPGPEEADDRAAGGPPSLPAGAGAGMDFLGQLHAPAPRSTSPSWTAGGGTSARTSPRSMSRSMPRKKAKRAPVELYALGGLGAAVVVLGVILAVMKLSGGEDPPPRPAPVVKAAPPAEPTKFGLNVGQRKQLFYLLIQCVDQCGPGPECREKWRPIQKRYNVDNDATEQILQEGFSSSDWMEPDNSGPPKGRINRKEWIKQRTETGRDPMLTD